MYLANTYLVPAPVGMLQGLSLTDRAILGLIYGRYKLSMANTDPPAGKTQWLDDHGDVYCYYAYDDIAANIGCSRRTVINSIKHLKDAGILSIYKGDWQGNSRIVINVHAYGYLETLERIDRSRGDEREYLQGLRDRYDAIDAAAMEERAERIRRIAGNIMA